MHFTLAVTLGNLLTILSVVIAFAGAWRLMIRPMRLWMDEHNLMWEWYSKAHGLPYRFRHGRNGKSVEEIEEMVV